MAKTLENAHNLQVDHRRQGYSRRGPRRHQAQEHPHRCARRGARAGFRHRQGALALAPPDAQRIRQRALRFAGAAGFGRSECRLGLVVAGRDALRDGHRHAALSRREYRAAGAHDPLAHRAAARARPLSRTAAPHSDQGDGARPRAALPVGRASSAPTWRRSAAASRWPP